MKSSSKRDDSLDHGRQQHVIRETTPVFDHLVPDYEDLEQDLLISFVDLRRNTMRTLYGIVDGLDKSPKGSVDVAIRPLVDLINAHPSFATLSSCSGRITLFDPHLNDGLDRSIEGIENVQAGTRQDVPELDSGKGRGGWLLSSHEQVEPSLLVQLLEAEESMPQYKPDAVVDDNRPLVFKHEPLLLHVAASTLSRGRQLLNLALRLGFRESGLVVTPTKVTVAIRGHSLALTVPLSKCGPLRPSNDYLRALINESNQRMQSNQDKLQRLQTEVEHDLFRRLPAQQTTGSSCNATFHPLPPLNLWGHAAVVVTSSHSKKHEVDVLVFGGYGCGPDTSKDDESSPEANKSCRRSNHVYCLSRQDGLWSDHWIEVVQSPLPDDVPKKLVRTTYGLGTLLVPFTAREGLNACVLPLDEAVKDSTITAPVVVAVWGGRAGPSRPVDELLMYEPNNIHSGGCSFMSPCDVRGKPPAPRWGHAFTALSGRGGQLAVLTGGRNANESLNSVHMLSLVITDESAGVNHLLWQTLDLGLPSQFHHSVVCYADSIIVFGGLSDPNDLLETFTVSNCESQSRGPEPVSAFRIEGGSDTPKKRSIHVENPSAGAEVVPYFGASACIMAVSDAAGSNTQHIAALAGGLPCNRSITSQDEKPLRCFRISNIPDDDAMELRPQKVHFAKGPLFAAEDIDFNSMVHHCAIPVPSCRSERTAEMLLLGGGVDSFAFGASFANCYRVQVDLGCSGTSPDFRVSVNSKCALDEASKSQRKSKIEKGARAQVTNVVYVTNKDAKTLKTALENASFLDKTFRMTKADPTASMQWDPKLHIAVPVTTSCLTVLSDDFSNDKASSPSWCSLVVGQGQQEMPYSSAILGLKQK